jgi:hypothetical protein
VHDRPFFLAERIDAEIGNDAAGIIVIGTEAEQPLVAHMGQIRIGPADHHGLAKFEHIRRHRHHLGRTDRAKKCNDVVLGGQF